MYKNNYYLALNIENEYIWNKIIYLLWEVYWYTHSSLNDSEKAIKLEPNSYSVLGNLRITIDPKDNFYDKIMMAAKKQYGDNIDIINIKKDMRNLASKSFITSAPIIVNCLVIRYD